MYLLEIELLRQEYLLKMQRGLSPEKREGDYYLENSRKNTLLQELAKECWLHQASPSAPSKSHKPVFDVDHEKLFKQQIEDSALQLVTNIAQKPLTITEILQQLEQEPWELIPLGKTSLETDIVKIVDDYPLAFSEVITKSETHLKGPLK